MKKKKKLVVPEGYYVYVGIRDKKKKCKRGADYKSVKTLRRIR